MDEQASLIEIREKKRRSQNSICVSSKLDKLSNITMRDKWDYVLTHSLPPIQEDMAVELASYGKPPLLPPFFQEDP